MAKRVSPLLRIRVFRNGAIPYFGPFSDFGYDWYSILSNEYQFGTVSYETGTAGGDIPYYAPTLEFIGQDRMRTPQRSNGIDVPVGLIMRPFIVPQDIGEWETLPGDLGIFQVRPCYMNPPVEMLTQDFQGVDDNDETVIAPWGSQSEDQHPSGASFAFSLMPAAVSPEYDPVIGGIPYYQFAWSGGKWAVRFFHHGNPILLRSIGGVMIPVMELASPGRISNGDNPDFIIGIVRVQRGALMISLDSGATYDVWREPNGVPISMPAGKYQFTGLGQACALGIHQVVYADNAHYDSPKRPMERSRLGAPTLIRFGYANQTNTSCTVANIAPTGGTTYMQYRVAMTSGRVVTPRFDYYYSPEAYIAEFAWPTYTSAFFPIHDGGATFEGRIRRLTVDKPFELDEATCSWTARYTVEEGGPIASFAEKLVQVWGGWLWDDGRNDVDLLFTGFITDAKVDQKNDKIVDMDFTAVSTALRPKRMQWRDSSATPFDGLSVNESLVKWAYLMGLNTSFIVPDILTGRGDNVVLPFESYEEPAYVPVPGESRWEIMATIAEQARLELGVTNDGSYALFPNDSFVLTPYTWDAAPADESASASPIEFVNYEQRIMDTYTGVLVRGKTMWGEQIAAWIYDAAAETNIFSDRFRPWPEWHVETVEKPVSAAWLGQIALGLAWNKVVPNFEMTWKGHLAHFVSRRHAVWVRNTTVGAGSLAQIGVLTLRHVFDKEQGLQAWTEVRGRKL